MHGVGVLHPMVDRAADSRTLTRRLGRFLLAAGPPLAGAVGVFFVAGILALENWGRSDEPSLVPWATPVAVCWLAGSVFWISGVVDRLRGRMWVGGVLALAVPGGAWAVLQFAALL